MIYSHHFLIWRMFTNVGIYSVCHAQNLIIVSHISRFIEQVITSFLPNGNHWSERIFFVSARWELDPILPKSNGKHKRPLKSTWVADPFSPPIRETLSTWLDRVFSVFKILSNAGQGISVISPPPRGQRRTRKFKSTTENRVVNFPVHESDVFSLRF